MVPRASTRGHCDKTGMMKWDGSRWVMSWCHMEVRYIQYIWTQAFLSPKVPSTPHPTLTTFTWKNTQSMFVINSKHRRMRGGQIRPLFLPMDHVCSYTVLLMIHVHLLDPLKPGQVHATAQYGGPSECHILRYFQWTSHCIHAAWASDQPERGITDV